MRTYAPDQIRNVALLGHSKSGKTTLTEAMLLASGAIGRAGRVEDGNTVSDYDDQEHAHGYSISTSLVAVEWDGHRLNVLDTPGYADFEGEVVSAAVAAETAVIAVDGAAGIEAGTNAAWQQTEVAGTPARFFAVTRLDREHTDFRGVVEALRARFGTRVAPLAIPGGEGIVLLVDPVAVPAGLDAEFDQAREMLIEAVAESNDDLLTHYLDGQDITADELAAAIAPAVATGALVPVLPLAASKGVGVAGLMDAITRIAPAPLGRAYPLAEGDPLEVSPDGSFVGQVFKTISDPFVGHLSLVKVLRGHIAHGDTVHNHRSQHDERAPHLFLMRGKEQIEVPELHAGDIGALPRLAHTVTGDVLVAGNERIQRPPLPFQQPTYRSAIHPHSRDDVDKLSQALGHIVEQDPSVHVEREAGTGELVLLTLGDVQAGIVAARLQREYGVTVDVTEPLVPYLETIRGSVQAEHRHKKQTGGRGQFGHVVIKIEPLGRGAGFEFAEHVVGGSVPKQYIPAVHSGIVEALPRGPLTKSRLVDLKVTLLDGSSHAVDSSEFAFKIAAEQALHQAVIEADPVLLEPIVKMRIEIPSELMGDVAGQITSCRGNVLGFEPIGEMTVVEALAPLAEVQRFGPSLRSLTHGRGRFTMEFDHHAEVPRAVQDQVIAKRAS